MQKNHDHSFQQGVRRANFRWLLATMAAAWISFAGFFAAILSAGLFLSTYSVDFSNPIELAHFWFIPFSITVGAAATIIPVVGFGWSQISPPVAPTLTRAEDK